MVKTNDRAEFIGQIIDIFEDFLAEKGIEIPNDDREDENDAIIYGMDYGELQTNLEAMMTSWGVLEECEMEGYKDYRFFKRKAYLIREEDFTEVMQELLDDSTLEIERGYPVLSMYSSGSDTGYDEEEIIDRIGWYLKEKIINCCYLKDLGQIYFVCEGA